MSHAEHLGRVSDKIAGLVRDYCAAHQTFRGAELELWVMERAQATPGSATRVLRDLRARGTVNFEVTDRRTSSYRIIPVVPPLAVVTLADGQLSFAG